MGSLINRRIAIYARFSTDKQSDASIDDQVHRAREWIRKQGGDPEAAVVYEDRAVSGASMDRPGMRALMQRVDRGEVDVIVTESVDRISRDAHESFGFRKALSYRDVDLECLDGTRIGTGDKNGLLMFGLRSMIGEQYLIDLADKTRRGLEGRARAGKATGALAYGFRNTDAGIEIDADRAGVVRRIFALYLNGTSFARIAATLNSEGVTPPRAHSRRSGIGWMHSAVRSMLLNERYRGMWTFGEREWRKVPGTNRRLARIRASGPLDRQERPELAIIDDATWTATQARFARNPSMPKKKRSFMLSGLLYCATCGSRMQFTGTVTRPYFACSAAYKRGTCPNRRNLPVGAVELQVLNVIRARLTACISDVMAIVVEEIRAFASSRPDRSADLRREAVDLDRKIANLVDALADAPSASLKAKLREIESRRSEIGRELAAVTGVAPVLPSPAVIAERVLSLSTLNDAPPDIAREAMRALLDAGRINCQPNEDRSFTLSWGLLPAVVLAPERQKPPGLPLGGFDWTNVVAGAGFEPTTFGL